MASGQSRLATIGAPGVKHGAPIGRRETSDRRQPSDAHTSSRPVHPAPRSLPVALWRALRARVADRFDQSATAATFALLRWLPRQTTVAGQPPSADDVIYARALLTRLIATFFALAVLSIAPAFATADGEQGAPQTERARAVRRVRRLARARPGRHARRRAGAVPAGRARDAAAAAARPARGPRRTTARAAEPTPDRARPQPPARRAPSRRRRRADGHADGRRRPREAARPSLTPKSKPSPKGQKKHKSKRETGHRARRREPVRRRRARC